MEGIIRVFRKSPRIFVILVTIILSSNVALGIYDLMDMGKNYKWRLLIYGLFIVVFLFVLYFKEDIYND